MFEMINLKLAYDGPDVPSVVKSILEQDPPKLNDDDLEPLYTK